MSFFLAGTSRHPNLAHEEAFLTSISENPAITAPFCSKNALYQKLKTVRGQAE